MPLFAVSKTNLRAVPQRPFPSEKALQRLIESNLDFVFKCRLVATEFSTGVQHAGRIDTLALSEDNNPVNLPSPRTKATWQAKPNRLWQPRRRAISRRSASRKRASRIRRGRKTSGSDTGRVLSGTNAHYYRHPAMIFPSGLSFYYLWPAERV